MRTLPRFVRFILPISALALASMGLTSVAQAQGADEEIEEIIVSGLRGKPRTSTDSPVPIDTFNSDAILAVSHTDTQDILQTLIPSFNIGREPISDGSSFIRAASLRGLPSHHTLVLINGKRRHRSALVLIGGSGTQGPDVATIPSSAIQSIEVLRDGASAQYGSDAIAGVINFNLKDNSSGFDISVATGEMFEGDGGGFTIGGNVGLPLGENGFLSITAEIDEQDFTERSHQYCEGDGDWFCLTPSNPLFQLNPQIRQDYVNGIQTPGISAYEQNLQTLFPAGVPSASVAGQNVMPWGQPNTESVRMFYNAGIELANGMELYSFGNWSESEGDGSFFYRYPQNGTIELLRRADGTLYSPLEKFPGGFTPRFEGEVTDIGIAGGLRGETDGGFAWDTSVRYGTSSIDYRLFNTINPSYGPDSPTDFRPGKLENEELQVQLDMSSEFDVGMDSPMVFAYGLSYMDETYNVHQSTQVASYGDGPHSLSDPYGFCDPATGLPTTVAGTGDWTQSIGGEASVSGEQAIINANLQGLNGALDCANPDDPVFQVVGVGANGFPGYSPAFSEEYNRDSYAVYGDLSVDISENFFLQGAIRYEDYSDFGDELVGKIAGRYRLSDAFAIRGSVGTGFRAPTPGQQGTTNVSTRLPNGIPVATGLFPATGSVAQALGATPLTAETSTSYTIGFTADLEKLSLTVDYYNIDIDDRFNAISTLDVSDDCPGADADAMAACMNFLALEAAGVPGANTIGGVFYFTNAFDSNTKGLDIVASYPYEWAGGSDTLFQFAYNWNESSLESDASAFLNEEDQFDFENIDPNTRWNLSATHSVGNFSIMGRGRFYGESENSNTSGNLVVQTFDSVFFFDLEASYQLGNNWRFTVGGRNIFDEFPDRTSKLLSNNDQCCGRNFVSAGVVPWQGGYFFGRATVSF